MRLTVRLALRPAVPEKLKRASCPGTVTFTVCAGPPEVSVADGSAPTSYTVAVTEPALGLTVSTITVYVPVSGSTVVSMNVGVPVTGP